MSLLDIQDVLDGLGHGVLLFASDDRLVRHNRMAGTILGADLNVLRSEGWSMAVGLFETGISDPEERLSRVRTRALQSERPIRFHIFRSGEYLPCWATAIAADDGEVYTMLTLDMPDWDLVGNVIDRFRDEMRDAIGSTVGHINLINKTLKSIDSDDDESLRLARRLNGFTNLIALHMSRAARLMIMLDRLKLIRTGRIREILRRERRRLEFADFIEDFLESLDETDLLDPETEPQDYRSRLVIVQPGDLYLHASQAYLTYTLQELLRNAIMYSLRGTPITVKAQVKNLSAQIDVIDEGYGIRQKEWERVFKPFERGRQPQIMSEFGYGLGLYLCKYEIESMGGRMWFTSEEGVGTTFSVMVPLWRDGEASQSDHNG